MPSKPAVTSATSATSQAKSSSVIKTNGFLIPDSKNHQKLSSVLLKSNVNNNNNSIYLAKHQANTPNNINNNNKNHNNSYARGLTNTRYKW